MVCWKTALRSAAAKRKIAFATESAPSAWSIIRTTSGIPLIANAIRIKPIKKHLSVSFQCILSYNEENTAYNGRICITFSLAILSYWGNVF